MKIVFCALFGVVLVGGFAFLIVCREICSFIEDVKGDDSDANGE